MSDNRFKLLETIDNPSKGRDYEVKIETDELTCLCPVTGQPDFASVELRYAPGELCVELKSFKIYLWSFRQEGIFHEALANRILDDMVELLEPLRLSLCLVFNVRGGIRTTIELHHPSPSL